MVEYLSQRERDLRRATQAFFKHDASGGIVLIAAAVFALLLSNSPLNVLYAKLLETPVIVQIGAFSIDKPLLLWINDGLMAVFFFLVGLEIKREIFEGQLSSVRRASLPVIAAIGGMAAPAMIYVAINAGDATALRGWAIPSATDIAFAMGILALLGSRVPTALKVFLLALAIIDDIGAIAIIALFYTAELSVTVLALAAAGLAVLGWFNYRGVTRFGPYLVVGLMIWVLVLKSGVHATLAGVAIALFVPLRARDEHGESPLKRAEHSLAPWVAFGVMPIFAFANAGVDLRDLALADLFSPIPLGIAAGLFFGNQLGIMSLVWTATKLGFARLPEGIAWAHIYGASLLAGIGFTMSLFIGTLAFADPEHAASVRLGVLAGSLLSAIAGYTVLRVVLRPNRQSENLDQRSAPSTT